MKTIGGTLRLGLAIAGGLLVVAGSNVQAQSSFPNPGPREGAVGIQGTIPTAPPAQAATIVTPTNNVATQDSTVNVTGACPNGLLVKIYNNGIFAGATMCERGTYQLDIAVFNGENELVARVFDALDQEGPESNRRRVTYRDAQFEEFGAHVTITSQYARRGAQPSQKLTWPVIISGGVGPYALTVDWGDGSPDSLYSVSGPGEVMIDHVYKTAGTYDVFVRVVDKNRTEGFLRVVAVSAGNASGVEKAEDKQGDTKLPIDRRILLVALGIVIILLPTSFWLGRRYELAYLRQQIERDSQA